MPSSAYKKRTPTPKYPNNVRVGKQHELVRDLLEKMKERNLPQVYMKKVYIQLSSSDLPYLYSL